MVTDRQTNLQKITHKGVWTLERVYLQPPRHQKSSVFLFLYLKEGGIVGINERSSYDSFTKQLVFIDGLGETEQAQIVRITPETENNLKNMIRSSNLQRIQSNYPPIPGSADYFTYTLFVI